MRNVLDLQHWMATRQDDFVADLAQLVNTDCGTANKAGVDRIGAWICERLDRLGAQVERRPHDTYGDMLLARWPGRGDRRRGRVLLSGHMDTVYPDGTVAARPMQPDPADPNRLLGPGTCDMKAGLLAGLYAIEALRALGMDGWDEVAMIFGSEEEIGSPASRHWLMALAELYDAGLVLEPARANGDLVTGRKGGGFWRVKVEGRAAHAGVEPEKGASAFLQLCHHALALDAINGTIPGATVVIGTAKAGEAGNMVPPHAEMTVDGRALDPEGLDRLYAAVHQAIDSSAGRIGGTTTSVSGDESRATMPRNDQNLRLFEVAQGVAETLGLAIGEQTTGGTSDGNFLAAKGMAVLDGLGPVGGKAHSPEEFIRLDSVAPRVALLAGTIWRLTAGAL